MEVVVRFFYYFVVSLLEVTKFYIIGRYILAWKTKEWTWKRIIVAGIGLIAIAFFFSIFLGRTNPFVVYVLFLLMENFVTFEECVWKIVCATMIEMYAISAIDIIVHGLYVVVLGGIGVDFQVPVKVLVSITTITFLGIVAYAMHYKLQCYIRKIPIRYYIIFIGLATGNGILLGEFGDVIEKGNMKICIAYIFIVLGVFLELALLLILAATREVYKEKDLLNQKYLKWQEEHYTYLEQRETATKKFRHDMRNHIYILQHLLKQEKLEEAKQYADELEEHFASVGTTISVNHGIVDAILNKYAAKCQEKKIGLVVKGYMPQDCSISSFDLCVIFSNLLSNAIEAAEQCAERRINLELRHEEDTIMLCIKNTFDGKLEQENGLLQTRKQDKQLHGYGLENVRECVEKNDGHMEITEEALYFVVSICIKNSK